MNTYKLRPAKYYLRKFDGSPALFEECWREYSRRMISQVDEPRNDNEVVELLHTIAAEIVANPGSRFYVS